MFLVTHVQNTLHTCFTFGLGDNITQGLFIHSLALVHGIRSDVAAGGFFVLPVYGSPCYYDHKEHNFQFVVLFLRDCGLCSRLLSLTKVHVSI